MSAKMPIMPKENKVLSSDGVEKAPALGEVKQTYNEPAKDVSNDVEVSIVPKEGIAVTATMKGFYGQLRLREGDKFVVKKFENLGEWMICDDKILERERKKFFKNKKAKK